MAFPNQDAEVLQIHADHYFRFNAEQLYKAAGVAIPVFSLRSENGFGVGEFTDIKKLADWAHKTHLSIIQILPINDTTANYTWTDSYPYAAISVYALHPQYLSLEKIQFGISEAFQMAALKQYPIIYLVQDNGWDISANAKETRAQDISEYIKGFHGIEARTIDGTDFWACYQTVEEVIATVRKERRPFLIHAKVPLLGHHTSGVRKECHEITTVP